MPTPKLLLRKPPGTDVAVFALVEVEAGHPRAADGSLCVTEHDARSRVDAVRVERDAGDVDVDRVVALTDHRDDVAVALAQARLLGGDPVRAAVLRLHDHLIRARALEVQIVVDFERVAADVPAALHVGPGADVHGVAGAGRLDRLSDRVEARGGTGRLALGGRDGERLRLVRRLGVGHEPERQRGDRRSECREQPARHPGPPPMGASRPGDASPCRATAVYE